MSLTGLGTNLIFLKLTYLQMQNVIKFLFGIEKNFFKVKSNVSI